ncbi:MAG TPA: beta-propeller fold lactonase family protein [Chloroflexota bacterium]|jgi:DNA-binding beta-propeller fold protein YncE
MLTRRQALTMFGTTLGAVTLALAAPALGVMAEAGGETTGKGEGEGNARRQDRAGYVYVNLNTAPMNTIAGFARRDDGSLTPLPGSPFAIGGVGTGKTIGSQGALQASSDGRYLLAADAMSNQISVLHIKPDGALRPADNSPVTSGGMQPVSIAIAGNLVYVGNTGTGGSNYTGFTLNPGGHLRPIANSTVTLPDGSGLGDILLSPNDTHLIGTRVATSLIDSFTVGGNGRLTPAPGSPFPAQTGFYGPFGSAFRTTNPSQLYVTNAHNAQGGGGPGTVSAYTVATDGTLSPIGASPFPDLQIAPCWATVTPDGRTLFAANTASDTISTYAIVSDGSLTLVGSTLLRKPAGATAVGPFDLHVDPSGQTLYVADEKLGAVSIFSISGNILSELASSPVALPTGITPFGLVIV